MANTGSGSTLSNLTATRRRLNKTREMLGLSERGIQKPQTAPPPRAPADTRPPQEVAQPGEEIPPEMREQMLSAAGEFLGQMQAGGQGVPGQGRPPVTPVSSAPTGPVSIEDRIRQLGAERLPVEQQFYRVSGRSPSPREREIFNARLTLERQLGRPPTKQEMKQYIIRPGEVSPAYPVAFEEA